MNVISKDVGRTTQLFVPDEIQPTKGMYLPEMIRMVAERYGFAESPSVEATMKQGAIFKQGRFIIGGNKFNISDMGVFNDGVIVSASDTKDSEYILDDVLMWLKDTFGIREPKTIIPKTFFSQVVVELESSVEDALRILDKVRKLFHQSMQATYKGIEIPVAGLSSIGIGIDSKNIPGIQEPIFSLQRRVGRPYAENRYFCSAPLKTEDHLELLAVFADAIAPKKSTKL
jgi:hypothetical protein